MRSHAMHDDKNAQRNSEENDSDVRYLGSCAQHNWCDNHSDARHQDGDAQHKQDGEKILDQNSDEHNMKAQRQVDWEKKQPPTGTMRKYVHNGMRKDDDCGDNRKTEHNRGEHVGVSYECSNMYETTCPRTEIGRERERKGHTQLQKIHLNDNGNVLLMFDRTFNMGDSSTKVWL